jgi:hypothetical protein
MGLAFFICLGVAVVGTIVAIANMIRAVKGGLSSNKMVVHILAGSMYALGGIGALITGIIWLVQYFSANPIA